MLAAFRELREASSERSILKGLWSIGILTIIVFSIIYIDRLFELVRGFDQLRAFARQMKQLITQFAELDKAVHFSAYAVVALIGFFAVSKRKYRVRIAAGMIALGIVLEIVQLMVPGRKFEFYDWFADVLGIGVAYFLFSVIHIIWQPKKLNQLFVSLFKKYL